MKRYRLLETWYGYDAFTILDFSEIVEAFRINGWNGPIVVSNGYVMDTDGYEAVAQGVRV